MICLCRNLNRGCVIAGLICASGLAELASEEPFQVGQHWVYEHQGPRPGGVEPNAIDGQRILRVISVVEEQGEMRWVVEERFTNGTEAMGRLYVSPDRLVVALDLVNQKGETAKLQYDPPVPYQVVDMEIGERKTFETTLRVAGGEFAVPCTLVIERLEDETVTTPAGEFPGCGRYRIVTESTFNIKIAKVPLKEERERWHHPAVNGLVKEVYRRGPVKFLTWSRPGYTATSVLTSFGEAEAPPAGGFVPADNPMPQEHAPPRGRSGALVLLGIATFLAAAIWLRRKWSITRCQAN